jgi:hypothetical protein
MVAVAAKNMSFTAFFAVPEAFFAAGLKLPPRFP